MSSTPKESSFSKLLASRMTMPEDLDHPKRVFKAAKIKEESTPRSASPGASASRTPPTKQASSKPPFTKPPSAPSRASMEIPAKAKHSGRLSKGKDSASDPHGSDPSVLPKHLSKLVSLMAKEIPADEDKRVANSSPGSLTEDGATKALSIAHSFFKLHERFEYQKKSYETLEEELSVTKRNLRKLEKDLSDSKKLEKEVFEAKKLVSGLERQLLQKGDEIAEKDQALKGLEEELKKKSQVLSSSVEDLEIELATARKNLVEQTEMAETFKVAHGKMKEFAIQQFSAGAEAATQALKLKFPDINWSLLDSPPTTPSATHGAPESSRPADPPGDTGETTDSHAPADSQTPFADSPTKNVGA